MSHHLMPLKEAAEHVHLDVNDLRHVAQRGEIDAIKRSGDNWLFDHEVLDEWAQRNLLAATPRELTAQHRLMMDEERRAHREQWSVAELFVPEAIDLAVTAKAKTGILRDMTDLAEKSGKVYDADALFKGLVAREEAASTAIGEGLALLHPKQHDPYLFEDTFVAYGRSINPIFFGASDGESTQHFFLICATDHALHLHILARLAMLAHGTDLMERLTSAEDAEGVLAAIRLCEEPFLKP